MQKLYFWVLIFIITSLFANVTQSYSKRPPPDTGLISEILPTLTPSPTPTLKPLPERKILENDYHIFQTFNNCGPASLSMALSYFGINASQKDLGDQLRPYQNSVGDNDDKSVTLTELGEKAREYNLIPYHRPNGDSQVIKNFINYDIPVIARTVTKVNEDIGHFRVIKGYDEETFEFIQDDSLQGKNLHFSYETFDILWEKFNYEYLILVPADKKAIVERILEDNADERSAWQKAADLSRLKLEQNPNDIYARFNLSVALYNVGNYQDSVEEFEKVENSLPFRTLWYQIEPIQAYFELGNFAKVFEITDKILSNGNRAFSELYFIRGQIYLKQGNISLAHEEFKKAVFYNSNFSEKIPDI